MADGHVHHTLQLSHDHVMNGTQATLFLRTRAVQ